MNKDKIKMKKIIISFTEQNRKQTLSRQIGSQVHYGPGHKTLD